MNRSLMLLLFLTLFLGFAIYPGKTLADDTVEAEVLTEVSPEAVTNECQYISALHGEISSKHVIDIGVLVDRCLTEDKGEVSLRITSGGGSGEAGLAIFEMISLAKQKLTTKAHGTASSAAVLIFLAGNKRLIGCHSYIIIHDPSIGAKSNSSSADLRLSSERIHHIREASLDIYVSVTGQKRELLSEMMSNDTLLNAEAALRLGIATEIIGCPK